MDNDEIPPLNVFAAQQSLLRERLRLLLATLHPALLSDIERALQEQGKLLSQPQADTSLPSPDLPAGTWPLLTLLVAQHISPDIDTVRATSVAIAVECFVCALDLLDDVEDEDQTPIVQAMGVARTLNVSTALLILALRSILSLSQEQNSIAPALILRLLDALEECALTATAGQHRDLLAEQRLAQDLTREECIEIAAAKAGAIMRLACRLGAVCSGASDEVCEQFSQLGELLGIAHQLDNDAHDLYDLLQGETSTVLGTETSTRSVKSDLARGKKTLPVVLAARAFTEERGTLDASLDVALKGISKLADDEKQEYLRLLRESIIATWGICLLYRERARDRLQEIEAQRPVASTLRRLLGFE